MYKQRRTNDRTNQNKKPMRIFVTYKLGIWYFLLINALNTTRNWNT